MSSTGRSNGFTLGVLSLGIAATVVALPRAEAAGPSCKVAVCTVYFSEQDLRIGHCDISSIEPDHCGCIADDGSGEQVQPICDRIIGD